MTILMPYVQLKRTLFLSCTEWSNGPEFLAKPKTKWPQQSDFVQNEMDTDPEVKQPRKVSAISVVSQPHFLKTLFDKYSDWNKLVRVCGWLLRCKTKWLSLVRKNSSTPTLNAFLSTEEIISATLFICAYVHCTS